MIVQVSVYDKIISKVYERNGQFSPYLIVHTLSILSICIKSLVFKYYNEEEGTFIVIPQNNISMTMTIFEDTLRHLLR